MQPQFSFPLAGFQMHLEPFQCHDMSENVGQCKLLQNALSYYFHSNFLNLEKFQNCMSHIAQILPWDMEGTLTSEQIWRLISISFVLYVLLMKCEPGAIPKVEHCEFLRPVTDILPLSPKE